MKVTRMILLVLAVLLAASFVYAGGNRDSGGLTLRKGVLSIGMEMTYPPMEYWAEDGKTPLGFDVELGKAIAAKMGLKPDFVDTSWDGIFAGVNANKYDCIISAVTIYPARLEAHNFSKPYISNTIAMVLPKDSNITARSPEECAGLNVAFQTETTADEYMEELAAGGLRYTPRRYDSMIQCFNELQLGRLDAVITDLLVAYEFVGRANSPFEIVWQSAEDDKFGICMKKGNDALTAAINQALDALWADGTLLRLSRETFDGMDLVTSAWK